MSNSILPLSGNTYIVQNAAAANVVPHVLDNENGNTVPGTIDGNPILSWSLNSPGIPIDHESDCVHAPISRCDRQTQQLVQGGAPLAWILLPVDSDPTVFKMTLYDDVISKGGNLLATDVNTVIQVPAPDKNTAELIPDSGSDNQLWSFILQDPV